VFIAVALLVALFALPQSWAVFFVTLMLAVLFVERIEAGRAARSVALALVFVLGVMAYQAHGPQRFDRLEFSIPQNGGAQQQRVRVALIGTRGDAYVVAACDRKRVTVLDRPGWRSTRPVLLRVAKNDVLHAEIVARRYAFFEPNELSLAGALLSMVDRALGAPALIPSVSIFGPFAGSLTRDVCGGVGASATHARATARAR
jgi:hypothetical protein